MPQAVKKRGAGGRPTKYKTEFCDRAFDFALVGMTDGEIAGALKIDEATLYRWKNSHPAFCEAIKTGRDRYDNEVVETALRQRAAGYDYQEEVMTREGPSVITERWRDRVETDIRAAVVNIEATPEEKARIIAAALSRGANASDT